MAMLVRSRAPVGRWRVVLAALAFVATQVAGLAMGAYSRRLFGTGDFVWTVVFLAPAAGAFVQASILYAGGMQGFGRAFKHVFITGLLMLAGLAPIMMGAFLMVVVGLPVLVAMWCLGIGFAMLVARLVSRGRLWVALLVALAPVAGTPPVAAVSEPAWREVVTVMDMDAPPEVVWRVFTNPIEIPADAEMPWSVSLGTPRPIRCEIEGSGEGAMRYCYFDTGIFDERVTVWDEGRELAFTIADQPEETAFLIDCRRGQILLERLPDGGTRVRRTTWYGLSMDGAVYFGLWTDWLIHHVHEGSMGYIRRLAEGEGE